MHGELLLSFYQLKSPLTAGRRRTKYSRRSSSYIYIFPFFLTLILSEVGWRGKLSDLDVGAVMRLILGWITRETRLLAIILLSELVNSSPFNFCCWALSWKRASSNFWNIYYLGSPSRGVYSPYGNSGELVVEEMYSAARSPRPGSTASQPGGPVVPPRPPERSFQSSGAGPTSPFLPPPQYGRYSTIYYASMISKGLLLKKIYSTSLFVSLKCAGEVQ